MEPTADVIAAVGLQVMDGVRQRNPIVADSGTSFGESRRDGLTQFRLRNMAWPFTFLRQGPRTNQRLLVRVIPTGIFMNKTRPTGEISCFILESQSIQLLGERHPLRLTLS